MSNPQKVLTIYRTVRDTTISLNLIGVLKLLDEETNKLNLDIVSVSDQFYPPTQISDGNVTTTTTAFIARTIVYKKQ